MPKSAVRSLVVAQPSVSAVVLTYNRKDLLEECLTALRGQTRSPDRVTVVDNHSSDGTAAFVRAHFPEVDLLALPTNEHCAGGYHEGIRSAHAAGADWIWLLDDDAIASPDALEQLTAALDDLGSLPPPLLLAGKVIWNDGRLHPMNVPGFEREDAELYVDASGRRLLPIRSSTFVSLFVSREAVDRYGLPHKSYVIYGDDIEYTARILQRESGYLVPASVVHHKTKTPRTASVSSGDRFYYHVRNLLYMMRGPVWTRTEKLSLAGSLVATTLAYLRHNSFRRQQLLVVLRGVCDGLRRGALRG